MSDTQTHPDFEQLLEYLRRTRGFDFTGYKRSSVMRRIVKRMQTIELSEFADYIDYLEVHPEEFTYLFNTILINVTSFFRDQEAWEVISREVLPKILGSKQDHEPIRIWSAGCASGQEAYTLAMVLAEVLGTEAFRHRVKIYATDVDEEALNYGRQASYTPREVEDVPQPLLQKYFERNGHLYVFSKDLRSAVIFGRHDLTQDAPISRIDLLVCRNILMYFNAEIQERILTRFHFALRDGGFLFLGRAEMLFAYSNLYSPVDLRRRIFTKVPGPPQRARLFVALQNNQGESAPHILNHVRLRDAAFKAGPVAQLVVDANGFLAFANEQACQRFGLAPSDQGRPLQDLQIAYRAAQLRPCIEQAYAERRTVLLPDVEWTAHDGAALFLDIQITPLLDNGSDVLGVLISLQDVSRYKRAEAEVQRINQELEAAYEELQSTGEELETTNEELQSTVEELETTNEELQSTNEELETMNEELRERSDELNHINGFLESILTGLRRSVVVLNQDLYVQVWNNRSTDLWGLRADEVEGKHFLNLDIGLPVTELMPPIRACLSGERDHMEVTLNARNRRGRDFQCRVDCTPLMKPNSEIRGVILLMEESQDPKSE
ncbi:MAG TPA: CheR family methyltransferase [Chthonomonadaceae bacterium]|nr:CheR family methyltransferase [Chthonomonadaceae bacterium]